MKIKSCLKKIFSLIFSFLLFFFIFNFKTPPVFADCGLPEGQNCADLGGVCIDNACYYNGMSCAVNGCADPGYYGAMCQRARYDNCATAYGGDGFQSWCCYNPLPTSTPVPTSTPTPPPTPTPTLPPSGCQSNADCGVCKQCCAGSPNYCSSWGYYCDGSIIPACWATPIPTPTPTGTPPPTATPTPTPPGSTPTSTPTPTTPPDLPCCSCAKGCGGDDNKSHCYASDGTDMGCQPAYQCFMRASICMWDPTNCQPPGPPGCISNPPSAPAPRFKTELFISSDNQQHWSTLVNVEPGDQIWLKIKTTNRGERNDQFTMADQFTVYSPVDMYRNTDHTKGIYLDPGKYDPNLPGFKWSVDFADWGGFPPGGIKEEVFDIFIKDYGTQNFLNRAHTADGVYANPGSMGFWTDQCYWDDETGYVCVDVNTGCDPSWIECFYDYKFYSNDVTVNIIPPPSPWMRVVDGDVHSNRTEFYRL